MTKEVILVSLIEFGEINVDKSKTFTDVKKAEEYYINLIKELFPMSTKYWSDYDIVDVLDDSSYEEGDACIYINEIELVDN